MSHENNPPRRATSPATSRATKRLSIGLGLLMFAFGLLKFVSPTIAGWFDVQIEQSHLPHSAILLGKLGEIATGTLFLLPWLRSWNGQWRDRLLLVACSSLIVEMLVATYVHLQPEVPAAVLPLGIKPPVMPLTVLLLAAWTAILVRKDGRDIR